MASPERRLALRIADRGYGADYDNGPQDITGPTYLVRPSLGPRRARILSGRGIEQPGYRIIGTQPGALDEGLVVPRVLKMVSPLTGQGPADPRDTGYFYGMDFTILQPRIVRQRKAVASNTGYTVVRPPRTFVRRMDNRGVGSIGSY